MFITMIPPTSIDLPPISEVVHQPETVVQEEAQFPILSPEEGKREIVYQKENLLNFEIHQGESFFSDKRENGLSEDLSDHLFQKPVIHPAIVDDLLIIELDDQAWMDQTTIYVNGKKLDGLSLKIEEDGYYHVSWEVVDQNGIILDSSETVLVKDTTPPILFEGSDTGIIWVSNNVVTLSIEDQSEIQWEVFLDGQSLGQVKQFEVETDAKEVTIIAKDQFGNGIERSYQLKWVPGIIHNQQCTASFSTENDLLTFFVTGDYEGSVLKVSGKEEFEIPVTQNQIDLVLSQVNQSVIALVHPFLGIVQEWTINLPEQEETTVIEKPVEEESEFLESNHLSKPSQENPEESTVLQTWNIQNPLNDLQDNWALPPILPEMEVWLGSENLESFDKLILKDGNQTIDIVHGFLQGMEFYIEGEKQSFSSLQEVYDLASKKVIKAKIEAKDLSGQIIEKIIDLVVLPEPIQSKIEAFFQRKEVIFSFDEQGRLQYDSSPIEKMPAQESSNMHSLNNSNWCWTIQNTWAIKVAAAIAFVGYWVLRKLHWRYLN